MSWASASGRIIARAVSVPDLVMRTAGYDGATEASVQQSAADGALHDPRGMTLLEVGWPAASAVCRLINTMAAVPAPQTGPSADTSPHKSLSATAIATLEGTHPARSGRLSAVAE